MIFESPVAILFNRVGYNKSVPRKFDAKHTGDIITLETPMNLPIQFPREADTIYEDARAYRKLPPSDRLLVIIDLIASGMTILDQSPQGKPRFSWQQAQEAEWQRIQKELFARHGY